MILLRNCPHNNGIYTLINEDQDEVLKSSYSDDGIIRIRNEYAGYTWYFKQNQILNKSKLELFEIKNGKYSRLQVKLFSGHAGECYNDISYNKEYILRAVNAYKEVWPTTKGRLSPVHGDFSIGNIIFNEDSSTIIDWEHFQPAAAPWGFDLVNLFYESIFFSFNNRDTLRDSDCKVFLEVRKIILELLYSENCFKCNLNDLTRFIYVNASIWGELVNKLPVMKFSTAQLEFVLKLEKAE
jgi:hypothetical protein